MAEGQAAHPQPRAGSRCHRGAAVCVTGARLCAPGSRRAHVPTLPAGAWHMQDARPLCRHPQGPGIEGAVRVGKGWVWRLASARAAWGHCWAVICSSMGCGWGLLTSALRVAGCGPRRPRGVSCSMKSPFSQRRKCGKLLSLSPLCLFTFLPSLPSSFSEWRGKYSKPKILDALPKATENQSPVPWTGPASGHRDG